MSSGHYWPQCVRIGCNKPAFNGQPNECCGRYCRGLIDRPLPAGIDSPRLDVAFFPDPRWTGEQRDLEIVAFYFPGRKEALDQMCEASFLGNFYHMGEYRLELCPPHSGKRVFTSAEAAFQALKFWNRAGEFEDLSGSEAFKKKQALVNTEDWTYTGYQSNWKAMREVIKAKFKEGPWVRALQRTAESFLLEHNSVSGRDSIWSDDNDGTGKNWLGLQLMLRRDELSDSASRWTHLISSLIDIETGKPWDHNAEVRWQQIVKSAATAVSEAVEEEEKKRMWLQQLPRWADTDGILSDLTSVRRIEDLPRGSDINKAFTPRARPCMNRVLTLWYGDITKARVDAIVNPAMADDDDVSFSIHHAAGPELAIECNERLSFPDWEPAMLTKGHKLPAKYVLHIAGLRIPGQVVNCYMNGLHLAAKKRLKSIALCCKPSRKYSCIQGAHLTLEFLRAGLESYPDLLDRMVLVTLEPEEYEVYARLLPYHFPRVGDLEFRLIQAQMVEVLFKWSGHGDDVYLAGSFNGWHFQDQRYHMDKWDGGMFIKALRLHRSIHRYKFIVDGQWYCCEDRPKEPDNRGGENNVIDLRGLVG